MCKVCAWDKVKERCLICGQVLDKGYPQLLAHCIAHYINKHSLYDENNLVKVIAINFEIIPPAHYEMESDVKDVISCNICQDRFPLYDKNNKLKSYPSRWLDHIIGHYSDHKLMEREWIAQKIVIFNYEAVVLEREQVHRPREYRLLTKLESQVYAEALHRMKTSEDEINKRKNK